MTQARLAFRGVHQDIAALQIRSQLHAGGKTRAAHTDKARRGHHVELAAHFFQLYIFLWLLLVRDDYDHLVVHGLHRSVNTGKNICPKPGRLRDQRALFYLVAGVNRRLAWRADMLLQQKSYVAHTTTFSPLILCFHRCFRFRPTMDGHKFLQSHSFAKITNFQYIHLPLICQELYDSLNFKVQIFTYSGQVNKNGLLSEFLRPSAAKCRNRPNHRLYYTLFLPIFNWDPQII